MVQITKRENTEIHHFVHCVIFLISSYYRNQSIMNLEDYDDAQYLRMLDMSRMSSVSVVEMNRVTKILDPLHTSIDQIHEWCNRLDKYIKLVLSGRSGARKHAVNRIEEIRLFVLAMSDPAQNILESATATVQDNDFGSGQLTGLSHHFPEQVITRNMVRVAVSRFEASVKRYRNLIRDYKQAHQDTFIQKINSAHPNLSEDQLSEIMASQNPARMLQNLRNPAMAGNESQELPRLPRGMSLTGNDIMFAEEMQDLREERSRMNSMQSDIRRMDDLIDACHACMITLDDDHIVEKKKVEEAVSERGEEAISVEIETTESVGVNRDGDLTYTRQPQSRYKLILYIIIIGCLATFVFCTFYILFLK